MSRTLIDAIEKVWNQDEQASFHLVFDGESYECFIDESKRPTYFFLGIEFDSYLSYIKGLRAYNLHMEMSKTTDDIEYRIFYRGHEPIVVTTQSALSEWIKPDTYKVNVIKDDIVLWRYYFDREEITEVEASKMDHSDLITALFHYLKSKEMTSKS